MSKPLIIGVSGRKQSGKSTLCSYLQEKFVENDIDTIEKSYKYGESSISDYKIYSFADPLKKFLIEVLGLDYCQCYGTDEEKNSFTKYTWDKIPLDIRLKYYPNKKENKECKFFSPVHTPEDWTVSKYLTGKFLTGREMMQIFGTDMIRNYFDDLIWSRSTIRLINSEKPKVAFISDVRFKSEVDMIMEQENSIIIRLTKKTFEDTHSSEKDLDNYDFSKLGKRAIIINNQNLSIIEKNETVDSFMKFLYGEKFLLVKNKFQAL